MKGMESSRGRPGVVAMRAVRGVPLCLSLALVAQAACGGRPGALGRPLEITGPVVVGVHLAYLDQSRDRVVLVRPFTREVRQVTVGRRPSFMMTTPDRARLLVVCKGWMAWSRDEVDEAPSLHLIDPMAPQAHRVFALLSPYDEVALSPDSRHGVAFFSASTDPGPDEVFRNPNAVAILDLDPEAADATPVEKNVRSFGGVPMGVLFSPANMAPLLPDGTLGLPRTLAVVFAKGYLTFLDVAHPERSEVTIRLTRPEDSTEVVPEQLVFVPEAGTAFLRASGSNDIYAFTLMARAPADSRQNDFVVSINTLAAGTLPADVGVFTDGGARKVLVANQQSRDLTVIDAYTSQFKNIDVGDPVDRVLLFPEYPLEMAVIYSQGSARSRIHFLGLVDVEAKGGQNLATLATPDPVKSIIPVSGRNLALVLHDDSRSVLSILDLEKRTLSPVTAHGPLGGYAFTPDGDQLVGFTFGLAMLGVIHLDTLSTRPLQLGFAPTRVITLQPMPGTEPDEESGTVVVEHSAQGGRITVVPYPHLVDRDQTFLLSGFLLEGLFDARWER